MKPSSLDNQAQRSVQAGLLSRVFSVRVIYTWVSVMSLPVLGEAQAGTSHTHSRCLTHTGRGLESIQVPKS